MLCLAHGFHFHVNRGKLPHVLGIEQGQGLVVGVEMDNQSMPAQRPATVGKRENKENRSEAGKMNGQLVEVGATRLGADTTRSGVAHAKRGSMRSRWMRSKVVLARIRSFTECSHSVLVQASQAWGIRSRTRYSAGLK